MNIFTKTQPMYIDFKSLLIICLSLFAMASATLHILLLYKFKRDVGDVISETDAILEYCLEKTLEHYNETEQYEKAQECAEYLNHLRSRYQ
jgi:hypothetical protein